jgi:predicted small integral membrane protein
MLRCHLKLGEANVIRILKCLLVLTVGLNGLFCALNNVANFKQAKDALAYVISGTGHETYPHTLFFFSNSSALHSAALIFVLVGEFAVGFFGLKGAWDLFAARNGTAKEFHAAKTAGVWASGIALLTWFGLFITMGGAFFEMWQTPMGAGSQDHAFDFAAISAITILFVYLTDD